MSFLYVDFLSTEEAVHFASSEYLKISENSRHIIIGHLYKLWKNRTAAIASGNYFEEADQIIPLMYHENIIPFNSEDVYRKNDIIATLSDYLCEDKRSHFTWRQRLKTCLGVAKGLSYLHSGVSDHGRVIHGSVRSQSILLNEYLVAKIGGVYGSILLRPNQPHPEIYRPTSSDSCSIDPVYLESGILNIDSDIYSYGILMFEVLTGMESDDHQGRAIGDYAEQKMLNLVLRFHDEGPEQLIDPYIIDDVDRRSFHMFIVIAYKCISLNIKDRPTMDEIVKTIEKALDIINQQAVSTISRRWNPAQYLDKFRIPLDEINKATKDFSKETLIKQGDTNVICKGHLSDHFQNRTAAIKIYLPVSKESQFHRVSFRSELEMVSILHHQNIVPFIGYCDEICAIVSEYAVNGSLYSQLEDPNKSITWTQRLKICIGVAKALRYLHSEFGEYQGVIHGDFSSRKILLYENLEPKVFGFCNSFLFPEKRKSGHVLKKPVVNEYYKDPVYRQSGIRNKDSDVYSYGVVLFEILTGMLPGQRLRIGDKEPLNLVSLVRYYYADKPDKFLDPQIRDEIDARSLETYREIAYKCISFNVKDRPSWNEIIKNLQEALNFQEEVSTSCQPLKVLSLSCDTCDSKGR